MTHDEKGEFEVRVKARGYIARYIYRHHPLDVVGWDGHLWPFAFNIEDFEPITGRVHQPPPVHQTFDGPGFVLCSFVPRLFDYHPLSIPAPYNHSNVDSDEVIYYVKGDFMSRRGIESAALTVHPNGIPHGPHPGTYEGSIGKARTDELAVMVDTFRPLQLTTHAVAHGRRRATRSAWTRRTTEWLDKELRRVQADHRRAVHGPSGRDGQRVHAVVREWRHAGRSPAALHDCSSPCSRISFCWRRSTA